MSSATICYPIQQQHNTQTQYYSFGPDLMAQVHMQYTHTTVQALVVSHAPVGKGSKVKGCGKSRAVGKLRAVLHTWQIVQGLHTTTWAFKGHGKQQCGKWAFGREQKPINYVWDRSCAAKKQGC